MSDIFLSYKSEDKVQAQTIAKALEKNGYSVWWDRKIPIGKLFDEYILEKLDEAKCVVVLWSNKSIKSNWVKEEAREGNDRGILFPVLIENVRPPLGFRGMQAANLIEWDGSSDNSEFSMLLDSVSGILERLSAEIEHREPEEVKSIEKDQKRSKKHKKMKTKVEEIVREKTKEEEQKPSQLVKPEKEITNSIGMKFTLIQAGEFMMGSNESDDEKPVHKVTISKPFYLGIYQVTQQEWNAVMKNDPSYFKGDKLPVEQVSWNDVQEYIKKLNEKEGTNKYRLPCEAEWEYAARAGTSTRYSFGDNESEIGDYAWFGDNSNGKTHEVGQKKPNPWNLYDMHGNVWEWVQDRWHGSYDGAPDDGSSWESGDGSSRVIRGGGWYRYARFCRSAYRSNYDAGNRSDGLGFRLLRVL